MLTIVVRTRNSAKTVFSAEVINTYNGTAPKENPDEPQKQQD